MASIFSKNGILAGRIDHYCLICAEQFMNEEETLAHIIDAQHKENLKTCGYFEKYKEDFIRKVKGIYFCEPCGLTFPTATKVELHIDEPSHIKEKHNCSPWLKREDNDIIVFNKFIITDDAWNSCIEDTCFICNTEYDDLASHKVIRSHILNLIKSEVIFDDIQNAVYRKIDARSYQCLTCNVIIGNLQSHFKTAEHEAAYKLYIPTIQKNDTKNTSQTCNNTNIEKKNQDVKDINKKTVKNEGAKVVNGNVNGDINKEADKNANKDVQENANKNVKKDAKRKGIKTLDKDKVKEKSKESVSKETAEELDKIYCKNIGARNYVTESNEDRWCILCEWLLEDSTEDHIRSEHHQMLLRTHKERLAEKDNNVSSKDKDSISYESVHRYQKSNINIDLINETAFCKKCSKNIDYNTCAIEKHIKEHNKPTNKKSPETLSWGIKSNGTDKTTLFTKPVLLNKEKRSEKTVSVGDYAKQHGFTHNYADNSYYCRPCCRRLPTALEDLQKHVASRIHIENTKESSNTDATEAPTKKPLFGFIKSFELVETVNEGCIIIINDKYWLNAFGFFFIARKDQKIFCQGCHIDLTPENVVMHIVVTDNHREMVEKCLLITSLENEFIREIKSDVYHCGYCNITENDWDEILDHIATAEHKRERTNAEKRLSEHQPNLYNRTSLKEIDDMIKQFVKHNRI